MFWTDIIPSIGKVSIEFSSSGYYMRDLLKPTHNQFFAWPICNELFYSLKSGSKVSLTPFVGVCQLDHAKIVVYTLGIPFFSVLCSTLKLCSLAIML